MSGPSIQWPAAAELSDAAGVPCADVPLEHWADSVAAARAAGYDYFDWLSAVDESDQDPARLDVLVHLAALSPLRRLLIRTQVPTGSEIGSLTGVFAGAAWHERETAEMFGIGFAGFDDGTGLGVRPLLLPDGFEGNPLRKSFMLAARAARPWPGAKEPGESADSHASPSRRRTTPPGVPDATWGPRRPGDPPPEAAPAGPAGRPRRSGREGRPAREDRPARRRREADDG